MPKDNEMGIELISVRLSPGDPEDIIAACEREGKNLSEFTRTAPFFYIKPALARSLQSSQLGISS